MCGLFSEIDWPGYGERESSKRGGDARRLPGDLLAWLWRERAAKEEETRSVLRKRRRCAVMPPVITVGPITLMIIKLSNEIESGHLSITAIFW
ncbi:hypothetical protein AAC387_Pa08g1022 [Persea americana]